MPLWPSLLLWASGAVIIVFETTNLLVFVGVALILLGLPAFSAYRRSRIRPRG